MELTNLVIAVPTIFVAAFLAVLLENARERRRTRKWVVRNLQALAASITDTEVPTAEQVNALERWLAAESAADMSEEDWRYARSLVFTAAPDFSPLIRSEAATSVPASAFQALYHLDESFRIVALVERALNDATTRDLLPLWYDRQVPLVDGDARRVATALATVRQYQELLAEARRAADRFLAAVAKL